MPPTARRLALATMSVLVAVVFAEAALRLWGPFGLEYMDLDERLGWRWRANAPYKFRVIGEAPCGWGSTGRINSQGLRDHEYSYVKPPGVFRIVALGDSFTAAIEHPLDVTWTKILERRLNANHPRRTFEVINAGRYAAGTAYEYLWYESEGRRYAADLVLLVVVGNDITDNFRPLAEQDRRHWLWDPFFELKDDTLVLDDSFKDDPGFRWRRPFMPLRQHAELVRTVLGVRNLVQAKATAAREVRPAPLDDLDSAIEVTTRLIGSLRRLVEAQGGMFLAFSGQRDYSWGLHDQPDRLLREMAAADPTFRYRDLIAPLERFTAVTGQRAFGCDALGDLPGHWSREGHAEVARLIHDTLQRSALLP